MGSIRVREANHADLSWIMDTARAVIGSEYQVHSARQFLVTEGHLLIAERDGVRAGFLTWDHDERGIETLALATTVRRLGVGSALMAELHRLAAERGCRDLRLVTTDDNAGAQRFYERLGYLVAEIRHGAMDECRRRFKPEIPTSCHDEIEYRLTLDLGAEAQF